MERLETDHLLGPDSRRYLESTLRYGTRNRVRDRDPETDSFAGSSISGTSAFTSSTVTSEDLEFREILPVLNVLEESNRKENLLRRLRHSYDDTPEFDRISEKKTLLQACVFIEDALHYRSIHHKVDELSLKWYRRYYSWYMQWVLYLLIFILHILAFFETPSSLSLTADLRYNVGRVKVPCGVTETIEIICLLLLLADLVSKIYFKGFKEFFKSKWLIAYSVVIIISIVDWTVSVSMVCTYRVRFRRILRPFFLLQNSSLMKKTVNSLRRTMSQLFSVLLLLFLHLYFFTLFGMLLFPKEKPPSSSTGNSTQPEKDDEYDTYFSTLVDSFMNLLILLTTANNPDVTMPAYNVNRFYAIFFIAFLVIGLYCLMNMLTAVIYNQFRGYFSNSMQASLFRRRLGVRAAFEVLRRRRHALRYRSSLDIASQGVPSEHVRAVIKQVKIIDLYKREMLAEVDHYMGCVLNYTQFQDIFNVLEIDLRKKYQQYEMPEFRSRIAQFLQRVFASRYFMWFGVFVAACNVVCITVELATEYEHVRHATNTYLAIVNLVLIPYYFIEQLLRMWALGFRRYCSDTSNIIDGLITCVLVVVEGIYLVMYGIPYWGMDKVDEKSIKLWDLVRVINMLILIKLLRVITAQYKAMFIVIGTIVDMIKNLKAFAGLLTVAYYSYAILGMILFEGKIQYSDIINATLTKNKSFECGSYEQLEYWSNNFDDFAAALVVLWDVMVVNNWHVFLHAYTRATNRWSVLYFIVWWLISVVIALNLFTALILENFIMRWDKMTASQAPMSAQPVDEQSLMDSFRTEYMTVHDMFRSDLQEPTEESLVAELRSHPFLKITGQPVSIPT